MKIGELMTSIAVVAFVLALCTIENMSLVSIVTMIISGAWILGYGFICEEERAKEGR